MAGSTSSGGVVQGALLPRPATSHSAGCKLTTPPSTLPTCPTLAAPGSRKENEETEPLKQAASSTSFRSCTHRGRRPRSAPVALAWGWSLLRLWEKGESPCGCLCGPWASEKCPDYLLPRASASTFTPGFRFRHPSGSAGVARGF